MAFANRGKGPSTTYCYSKYYSTCRVVGSYDTWASGSGGWPRLSSFTVWEAILRLSSEHASSEKETSARRDGKRCVELVCLELMREGGRRVDLPW